MDPSLSKKTHWRCMQIVTAILGIVSQILEGGIKTRMLMCLSLVILMLHFAIAENLFGSGDINLTGKKDSKISLFKITALICPFTAFSALFPQSITWIGCASIALVIMVTDGHMRGLYELCRERISGMISTGEELVVPDADDAV